MQENLKNMKVLGFDNWTGGSYHFERLVTAFSKRNMELSLLHLGSWGNDKGRLNEETIGTLPARDISYYESQKFSSILNRENPELVLFLSTDTFAHRAFIRHCRARNIPTIHLYHGIVRVQAVDNESPYRTNPFAQIRFAMSRVGKAIRHVWPAYINSLLVTKANANDWQRFIADILSFGLGRYIPVAASDARASKCCVYVSSDIEHATKKYNYSRDDVSVVGNPDLMRFGLSDFQLGSLLRVDNMEKPHVMYVDTGLAFTGQVYTSQSAFIEHMLKSARELELQGKTLVFKPHPQHATSSIPQALQAEGVDICSDAEFVNRLQKCCACIVEPSTLSMVPALMGMPLFLAKYGPLYDCRFGEILYTYPRVRDLRKIQKFTHELMMESKSIDEDLTNRWIQAHSGPLPAEMMPDRVAQLALSLLPDHAGIE